MSLSLTVFSQADTKIITTDSIVPLPKLVAREVVKDILRKDSCEDEIKLIKDNNLKLTKIIDNKDSLINRKDSMIVEYKHKGVNDSLVIFNKGIQNSNLENTVKSLGNQLKSTKRKSTWVKIGLGTVAAIFGYLLIAK